LFFRRACPEASGVLTRMAGALPRPARRLAIQSSHPEENFDADEEVKIAQASSFVWTRRCPAAVSSGRIRDFRW
jgi:hypothetical protein